MKDLEEAIEELDEEKAIIIIKELIKEKPPVEIFNAIKRGLQKVGEKFESNEYFLADLIYSGELFQELSKYVMPLIKEKQEGEFSGKIVFGTVKNDIHDIGKNIVISLLKAEGFEVIDVGVDIPAEKFVEVIQKEKPFAIGLSCLLTVAIEEMKNTIETIRNNGITNVTILVGGGPVDESVCKYVGADDWAGNAVDAIKAFKKYSK
ncbi:MAG: cobalamin B12-binding domain-containing protein [Candidatus Helarchaeota archaeon]